MREGAYARDFGLRPVLGGKWAGDIERERHVVGSNALRRWNGSVRGKWEYFLSRESRMRVYMYM